MHFKKVAKIIKTMPKPKFQLNLYVSPFKTILSGIYWWHYWLNFTKENKLVETTTIFIKADTTFEQFLSFSFLILLKVYKN